MFFTSTGTLEYARGESSYSLRVVLDPEIMRYYRSLLPKSIRTNSPMYPAHISVVRKEIPPNLKFWGKYDAEQVEFFYEHTIYFGTLYVWLNCYCIRLEEIRRELGLPTHSQYTLPPERFQHCFHSTIGNLKPSV